jgi:photosystem II stability/assembly factor-like uncharacterized protein
LKVITRQKIKQGGQGGAAFYPPCFIFGRKQTSVMLRLSFTISQKEEHMKNIFRFLFVMFCLFTTTNPLHAQWIKSSLPSNASYVTSFVAIGSNIFVGTYGGFFFSTNNGTSWTEVNFGFANKTVNALSVSGTNLFAGIGGGGIYLSTNDGTSWTEVNSGLIDLNYSNVISLAVSGSTIFAGVDGNMTGTCAGRIYRSVNNGTS